MASYCQAESSLLLVDHFDAVAGGKQLEFVHRDGLFSAEVPPYKILEFALGELETRALDQGSKLSDGHLLRVLVLDAIEESLQKLVILLLVCVLVRVGCVECAHKLTELVLIDPVWLAVNSVCAQVVHE